MAASAVERLVRMLAFCEAPFDGTSAPSSSSPARGSAAASKPASGDATASRGAMLMEIAKEFAKPSSQRLVHMLAFCEAPFDGPLDGTSAPSSSSPARGGAASKSSSPGDAAASRDALLMEIAKEFAKPSSQRREQAQQQQQQQQQRDGAVDGLAIFETVVLQLQ